MEKVIFDSKNSILHEGDIVHCKWGYDLIVSKDENGHWFGKLVCEPDDSCANIPYALVKEDIVLKMKKKKFEVGEKLYFYYASDNSVEGYTILDKEDRFYIDDDHNRVYYEMLHLQPDNKELADCYTEDYNAIIDGLNEDDERVIKYKEEHKEIKMVSLDDICEYIASNMRCDGYTMQSKTKFIHDLRKHFEK